VNAQPSDVDHRAAEALRQVVKPDFHHLIPGWLATAGEGEKRGFIRLADIAEPNLLKRIGRPQTEAQAARIMARPRQGFGMESYAPPRSPPGQTGFLYTMNSYGSVPTLPGPPGMAPPSAMEDPEEIAKIAKPGGCYLKLTDSSQMQLMKNKQRNTGTFQLFGGSGEYMTTNKSNHNLRSIGQEHLYAKIRGQREI